MLTHRQHPITNERHIGAQQHCCRGAPEQTVPYEKYRHKRQRKK